MRVAIVQLNPRFGDSVGNTRKAIELMHRHQADLYVLPELFHSGYAFACRDEVWALSEAIPEGPVSSQLAAAARKLEAIIIAGIAERSGDVIFNSAALFDPTGWIGTYRKIHLFDREKEWFSPGDRPFQIWSAGGIRVGAMICFDWIFPEAARSLALQGAQILCHPANLVLPYCQQAMITRCLENGVFALTANRTGGENRGGQNLSFTGKSQITGPRGEILFRAPATAVGVYSVDIDPQDALKKQIAPHNRLLEDRRPDLYTLSVP
ncbi:acyltransferase [candidate division KSB1 bacterium]|nr:acyltransferase [candidate division KSB1 bacterium]